MLANAEWKVPQRKAAGDRSSNDVEAQVTTQDAAVIQGERLYGER